jgi:hypothetical protein
MLFVMFVGGSTLRIFVIFAFYKKILVFYFLYFLFFGMFVRGRFLIIFVILYFIENFWFCFVFFWLLVCLLEAVPSQSL